MFEQTKYDSKLYDQVVKNYEFGKHYKIEKWHWGYTKDHKSYKEIDETIECPTQKDFDRELWDFFADFARENTFALVWGAPISLKERNPQRETPTYYDGLVFYLTQKEFKGCIENQNVSRFMSFLNHFGYGCPNLVIVE